MTVITFFSQKRLFRDAVSIITDQCGVPTTTDFLATTLALIDVYRKPKGDLPQLVHAVPCGSASWFGCQLHPSYQPTKIGEGLADIKGSLHQSSRTSGQFDPVKRSIAIDSRKTGWILARMA